MLRSLHWPGDVLPATTMSGGCRGWLPELPAEPLCCGHGSGYIQGIVTLGSWLVPCGSAGVEGRVAADAGRSVAWGILPAPPKGPKGASCGKLCGLQRAV